MATKTRRSALERNTARQSEIEIMIGLKEFAHGQIIRHIEERFSRHDLAQLVGAVLRAQGFQAEVAEPGPDGGVDILASTGRLAFERPRICVQVKSSKHPEDVATLRALQGAMENFKADQGLLVAWGGFTKALVREARQNHFRLRLWSAKELVEEIYRIYDHLPKDIQDSIPLERVWMLKIERAHLI